MGETRIQYGIWIPDGSVLDPGIDLDTQERRLERLQERWPEAQVVTRTVHYADWYRVPNDQLRRVKK